MTHHPTSPSGDAQSPTDIDAQVAVVHETIAVALRRIRLAKNLTQGQAAELAGLGLSTMWNMETRCKGTVDSLLRLAAALGIADELSELFELCAANEPVVPGDTLQLRTSQRIACVEANVPVA